MRFRGLLYAVLGGVLWVSATGFLSTARGDKDEDMDLVYFPSGSFLKQAVLGYDQAAASVAWLRMVQYYGAHVRSDRDFSKIYHMAQITTDLDPHFVQPYLFASFILLTDEGDPESSVVLLDKGLRHNPDDWQLLVESGLTAYLGFKDYEAASEYYRLAAEQPDAPDYVPRFAAFMTARAGSEEAALMLWTEALERAHNEDVRARIEDQIRLLKERMARGDS